MATRPPYAYGKIVDGSRVRKSRPQRRHGWMSIWDIFMLLRGDAVLTIGDVITLVEVAHEHIPLAQHAGRLYAKVGRLPADELLSLARAAKAARALEQEPVEELPGAPPPLINWGPMATSSGLRATPQPQTYTATTIGVVKPSLTAGGTFSPPLQINWGPRK